MRTMKQAIILYSLQVLNDVWSEKPWGHILHEEDGKKHKLTAHKAGSCGKKQYSFLKDCHGVCTQRGQINFCRSNLGSDVT